MSITKNILCAAIAAFASVASVQAVTINYTFNFSGSSALSSSKTFASTPGGISVDVTATAYWNNSWISASVGQYTGGLGVTNSKENGTDPSHTMDSYNGVDYLIFKFTPNVDVNGVTIGYEGYDDIDFRWWVNNTGTPSSTGGTQVTNASVGNAYTFSPNTTDQWNYLILAADRDNTGNDYNGLKVKSLSISYTTSNTPGVPDSGSTVAMLGVGLLSLAVFKRRK